MRTLSISVREELYDTLKHTVPSKQISKFVSKAIEKELQSAERSLERDYLLAERDIHRNRELEEWDALDADYSD